MEEMVAITKKEYQQLLKEAKRLEALEMMGVDNWEGYSDAMKYLKDSLKNG